MPIVLGGLLAAMTIAATPALADDPEREIQGIIQRGAGGPTDMVSRPVTPHAEAVPGQRVNLQNITGGVGAPAWPGPSAQMPAARRCSSGPRTRCSAR